MSSLGKLIPAECEAPAQSYRRFGVAFGDRFFTLLSLGLVWLIPAFADLRFVYAMFGWDVLVIVVWLADLMRLPRPAQLVVKRT